MGKEKAVLHGRKDLDAGYIRSAVRKGISAMPALTQVEISDTELEQIIAYLTATQK